MTKILSKIVFVFAILVGAAFSGGHAMAQATRTWVSGVGDDVNPCSRTAPCKTFAGAISKTTAGGEISVLDPGGFGALTITKSITLTADGDLGSVLVAGVNGIIVNAGPDDVVNIFGLEIVGISKSIASPGLSGVKILGAGRVNIVRCFIHDFSVAGVEIVPSTAAVKVAVDDTKIVNATVGVLATGPTNTAFAGVTKSALLNNANAGVSANGAKARIVVSDTTISGSLLDFQPLNSGATISFGNNTTINSGVGTITGVNTLR